MASEMPPCFRRHHLVWMMGNMWGLAMILALWLLRPFFGELQLRSLVL